MMRLSAGVATALCVALAGCGSSNDSNAAPIVCIGGNQAYLKALEAAPDAVLLGGETPITKCLPSDQSAGDQAEVGQRIVAVASELNKRSRKNPGGQEPVQLGYLDGAIEQGSSTTAGIHQDLVTRLEAAANFNRLAARSIRSSRPLTTRASRPASGPAERRPVSPPDSLSLRQSSRKEASGRSVVGRRDRQGR